MTYLNPLDFFSCYLPRFVFCVSSPLKTKFTVRWAHCVLTADNLPAEKGWSIFCFGSGSAFISVSQKWWMCLRKWCSISISPFLFFMGHCENWWPFLLNSVHFTCIFYGWSNFGSQRGSEILMQGPSNLWEIAHIVVSSMASPFNGCEECIQLV